MQVHVLKCTKFFNHYFICPQPGPPTRFEVSPPIPSQLRYAEHKLFNDDFHRSFQPSHNFESLGPQPQLLTITQQQNDKREESLRHQNFDLPSRPDLPEAFLPRLEPLQAGSIYSQTIHPVYPLISGFPPDFLHQINQLGNQLANNVETIQYIQNEDDEVDREVEKKKTEQKAEQQIASQQAESSTERQTSASQEQSLTVDSVRTPMRLLYILCSYSTQFV